MWKIYFWFITIISIIGLAFGYGKLDYWNFAALLEVSSSIFAIIGLYSYVYRKHIFQTIVWRVLFLLSIISIVLSFLFSFTVLKNTTLPTWLISGVDQGGGVGLIFGTVLAIPLYYALYKLSQGKQKK